MMAGEPLRTDELQIPAEAFLARLVASGILALSLRTTAAMTVQTIRTVTIVRGLRIAAFLAFSTRSMR